MESFDLSAPVLILFESDPIIDEEEKTKGFDIKLVNTRKLGNGYRGYYWKWFDHFRNFYFSTARENLQLPAPNDYEQSFKIAHTLYKEEYLKNIDTVEDFFGVMESIINSNK